MSLILSIIVVFKFAPVVNKNNPKTKEEIIKNKKIARRRILLLSIIIILGYIVKAELIDLWFMLVLTELSIAYSILKQKFLERGEKMTNVKTKVLENIAKLSKKIATAAEGKQSMFLTFEPKKPEKK